AVRAMVSWKFTGTLTVAPSLSVASVPPREARLWPSLARMVMVTVGLATVTVTPGGEMETVVVRMMVSSPSGSLSLTMVMSSFTERMVGRRVELGY
ncbi:MAG: hypothetical protein OXE47_11195, partial [Gammaproteobacteria bacterium]|nr:hypothetical protein [Gammaproteobacteria bacterium]